MCCHYTMGASDIVMNRNPIQIVFLKNKIKKRVLGLDPGTPGTKTQHFDHYATPVLSTHRDIVETRCLPERFVQKRLFLQSEMHWILKNSFFMRVNLTMPPG